MVGVLYWLIKKELGKSNVKAKRATLGSNWGKSPIRVQHSKLKRLSKDSPYRSQCPECKEGVLLMRRDPNTLDLLKEDHCWFCGQHYTYTDLKKLRIS